MNYINIMGGLGNQLFQYTFAKYLEKLTGQPIIFHTGSFDIDSKGTALTPRNCSLDRYYTQFNSTKVQVRYDHLITDDTFDSHSVSDNTFFNGYWQDKKYLEAVYDSIIKDLKLRQEYITEEMKKIACEMQSCESVAIHVRRKDYLNQYNKNIFYEVSPQYYAFCVRLIIEHLGHKPILYVFSDDYDYIRSYMENFCNCRTILMKPRWDYEDLYLMSQAKHHIIANSTFGWWGAILSDYSKGITIAPKHWFKDRRDPALYPDIWKVADNQIRLDKVSVIIPSYNVEDYIDRCLKSIEEQTYDMNNLEVILVNDASTDDTLKHLKLFEAKYPDNVILINLQENGGQGRARNIGLSYASGKYITFVDADDMIDVSMIYKMYLKAHEYDCDVVECGHVIFSNSNDIIPIMNDMPESLYLKLNDFDARKKLIFYTCQKTAVWGKLYRKSFIDNNNLSFIEHLFFEDIQFSGLVMLVSSSYYRIDETLYYYYSNNNGTVFSSYNKDRVHQEATATEMFLNDLYERNMLKKIMQQFGNELSIYCTTKAFVDPLTLLINSNLELKEILSEISWFKSKLLDIFPTAANNYILSDEYGICSLAIHLLKSPFSMTEILFDKVTSEDIIQINISDTVMSENLLNDFVVILPKLREHKIIRIPLTCYDTEHLLIMHAINTRNIILVTADRYVSPHDQYLTTNHLCMIINEYPGNHIIVELKDLFYDESDECINDLSGFIKCMNSHNNITLALHDEKTLSIAHTLFPNADLQLLPGYK